MIKYCLVCNKSFTTYPCLVSQGKGKYCSKICCNSKTLFKKGHISKLNQTSFKSGEKHPRFQGWRYCGRNRRYRMLFMPNYPMSDIRGYIREHRFVMEKHLGRYLTPDEEIHHIDGNGLNNNISNLKLMSNKHYHLKLEHKLGTYKNVWKKRKSLQK